MTQEKNTELFSKKFRKEDRTDDIFKAGELIKKHYNEENGNARKINDGRA